MSQRISSSLLHHREMRDCFRFCSFGVIFLRCLFSCISDRSCWWEYCERAPFDGYFIPCKNVRGCLLQCICRWTLSRTTDNYCLDEGWRCVMTQKRDSIASNTVLFWRLSFFHVSDMSSTLSWTWSTVSDAFKEHQLLEICVFDHEEKIERNIKMHLQDLSRAFVR